MREKMDDLQELIENLNVRLEEAMENVDNDIPRNEKELQAWAQEAIEILKNPILENPLKNIYAEFLFKLAIIDEDFLLFLAKNQGNWIQKIADLSVSLESGWIQRLLKLLWKAFGIRPSFQGGLNQWPLILQLQIQGDGFLIELPHLDFPGVSSRILALYLSHLQQVAGNGYTTQLQASIETSRKDLLTSETKKELDGKFEAFSKMHKETQTKLQNKINQLERKVEKQQFMLISLGVIIVALFFAHLGSHKLSNIYRSFQVSPARSFILPLTHVPREYEKSEFSITVLDRKGNPINSGGDHFDIEIVDSFSSKNKYELIDHSNGTYTLSFVPTSSGLFDIIIKTQNRHLKSSPLVYHVSPRSAIDKSFIEVHSPHGIVSNPLFFDVVAMDKLGIPLKFGGDDFLAEISGPDFEANEKVELTYNSSGKYLGSFIPLKPGNHQIHVSIEGYPIKNSPFSIQVMRNPKNLPDQTVIQIGQKGVKGMGESQFSYPTSACVNSKGELIVAEYSNDRIQIFNKDLKFSRKFGSSGYLNGQFYGPYAVTVDAEDNIYVADYNNHRVQMFDPTGTKHLATIGTGTKGNNLGQFAYPMDVMVNKKNGNIYVVEFSNHRIQVFDKNRRAIKKFGSQGKSVGQLYYPRGIAINSKGEIIVSEYGNHRLQVFNEDGTFLRFIGVGNLSSPCHVGVDAMDNIYVANQSGKNKVRVFDGQTGELMHVFGDNLVGQPEHVMYDPIRNSIFIVDYTGHAVYSL